MLHPILKFSCLIPLYLTIINPKVNSIKSVRWWEKFLKPPHTLPRRPSLPTTALWLSPTDVAFWEDVFVCQRRAAFQRLRRTESLHLSFLEFSPADRVLLWFQIEETKEITIRRLKETLESEMKRAVEADRDRVQDTGRKINSFAPSQFGPNRSSND